MPAEDGDVVDAFLEELHEREEGGVTEVQEDKGKNMGLVRELGEFSTRRKWSTTAADRRAPATKMDGLGHGIERGWKGKMERGRRLLIEQRKEGDKGFNRLNRAPISSMFGSENLGQRLKTR